MTRTNPVISLTKPARLHDQVSDTFENPAINRAEVASCLHRRFETATQLSATKFALKKVQQKLHKNKMC